MLDRSQVQRGFIGSVVAPMYEAMGELSFLAAPDANNVFKVMYTRAVDKLQTLYGVDNEDDGDVTGGSVGARGLQA